jgi:hypothetical protein
MPNHLTRSVAVLLAVCLVGDPATYSVFASAAPIRDGYPLTSKSFDQQALATMALMVRRAFQPKKSAWSYREVDGVRPVLIEPDSWWGRLFGHFILGDAHLASLGHDEVYLEDMESLVEFLSDEVQLASMNASHLVGIPVDTYSAAGLAELIEMHVAPRGEAMRFIVTLSHDIRSIDPHRHYLLSDFEILVTHIISRQVTKAVARHNPWIYVRGSADPVELTPQMQEFIRHEIKKWAGPEVREYIRELLRRHFTGVPGDVPADKALEELANAHALSHAQSKMGDPYLIEGAAARFSAVAFNSTFLMAPALTLLTLWVLSLANDPISWSLAITIYALQKIILLGSVAVHEMGHLEADGQLQGLSGKEQLSRVLETLHSKSLIRSFLTGSDITHAYVTSRMPVVNGSRDIEKAPVQAVAWRGIENTLLLGLVSAFMMSIAGIIQLLMQDWQGDALFVAALSVMLANGFLLLINYVFGNDFQILKSGQARDGNFYFPSGVASERIEQVKGMIRGFFPADEDYEYGLALFGDLLVFEPLKIPLLKSFITELQRGRLRMTWSRKDFRRLFEGVSTELVSHWRRGGDHIHLAPYLADYHRGQFPEDLVRRILKYRIPAQLIKAAYYAHFATSSDDAQYKAFLDDVKSQIRRRKAVRQVHIGLMAPLKEMHPLSENLNDAFDLWISAQHGEIYLKPRDPDLLKVFHQALITRSNKTLTDMIFNISLERVGHALVVTQQQPIMSIDIDLHDRFPQTENMIRLAGTQWLGLLESRAQEIAAELTPEFIEPVKFIDMANAGYLLYRWALEPESAIRYYARFPRENGFKIVELDPNDKRAKKVGIWVWRKPLSAPTLRRAA